ncbi:MAG: HAD family hydrolase [Clostridiales bacterium]|nr:HAD family hydrolase [Clostridiales bacterium]
MIRAVLFDLDGTLTNTLEDIADAMNRSLRMHGLPEWPLDAYRYLVGDGAKKLAERAVREEQHLALSVQQEYQAYYQEHTQVKSRPYDGIPELLRALQARKLPLAVFSNKPDADTKHVVAHYFPEIDWAVVRGQIEGVPVKPDPTGALAAAQAMGVSPGEVLYLGDTATDMRCARNAGMHPVGALWGFRTAQELMESGAEHLVAHPGELLAYLDL